MSAAPIRTGKTDQATETRATETRVCRGAKHTQLTNCHFHVYPACLAILYGAKGRVRKLSDCNDKWTSLHHCYTSLFICDSLDRARTTGLVALVRHIPAEKGAEGAF